MGVRKLLCGDGLYPLYQIVARDGTVEGLFVDFLSYEDGEDEDGDD